MLHKPVIRLLQAVLVLLMTTNTSQAQAPELWGLECGVSDVDRAAEFYEGALGFHPVGQAGNDARDLQNGEVRLRLYQSDAPLSCDESAYIVLNIQVADLPQALKLCRRHGALIADATILPFPLGSFIPIRDPYGNRIDLISISDTEQESGPLPAVFNTGVVGEEIAAIEPFYQSLGFEVLSRAYLPGALPLVPTGAGMVVLHSGATVTTETTARNYRLVVIADDITAVKDRIGAADVSDVSWRRADGDQQSLIATDPTGNQIRLIPR